MYKEYIVTKDYKRLKKGDKKMLSSESAEILIKKGLIKDPSKKVKEDAPKESKAPKKDKK